MWFQRDVMRILAAAQETMRACSEIASPDTSEVVDAYQRGFVDALRSVGVAFGVSAPGRSTDRGIETAEYGRSPRYLPPGVRPLETDDDGCVSHWFELPGS